MFTAISIYSYTHQHRTVVHLGQMSTVSCEYSLVVAIEQMLTIDLLISNLSIRL